MRHGSYGPSAGVAGLLVAQDRRDEAIARLSMDAGNGSQLSAWQLTLLLGPLPP
jgi:hypothetical protein